MYNFDVSREKTSGKTRVSTSRCASASTRSSPFFTSARGELRRHALVTLPKTAAASALTVTAVITSVPITLRASSGVGSLARTAAPPCRQQPFSWTCAEHSKAPFVGGGRAHARRGLHAQPFSRARRGHVACPPPAAAAHVSSSYRSRPDSRDSPRDVLVPRRLGKRPRAK